jgi:hypothetical protein
MKAINITGKHNIDKMNEIGNDSYKSVRKHMINLSETDLLYKTQNDLVRDLYMNIDVKMNLNGCENMDKNTINLKSLFKSELVHKIQGYKGQDIKKEIHNQDTIIKLEDVLEKLVERKLTCFYCSKQLFVLYKNVREPLQWTLDRIDNDLNHSKENTCISCLKCNLQRRVTDSGKFIFTKKLKINKV